MCLVVGLVVVLCWLVDWFRFIGCCLWGVYVYTYTRTHTQQGRKKKKNRKKKQRNPHTLSIYLANSSNHSSSSSPSSHRQHSSSSPLPPPHSSSPPRSQTPQYSTCRAHTWPLSGTTRSSRASRLSSSSTRRCGAVRRWFGYWGRWGWDGGWRAWCGRV